MDLVGGSMPTMLWRYDLIAEYNNLKTAVTTPCEPLIYFILGLYVEQIDSDSLLRNKPPTFIFFKSFRISCKGMAYDSYYRRGPHSTVQLQHYASKSWIERCNVLLKACSRCCLEHRVLLLHFIVILKLQAKLLMRAPCSSICALFFILASLKIQYGHRVREEQEIIENAAIQRINRELAANRKNTINSSVI